ncbi:MAG TPA: LPS export ABC transporter periplasmic protein LptC [Terriglobales bacterium]|nr:LPS export ABC transporter periplasmic protein LptC [Terriglobales bacterium]
MPLDPKRLRRWFAAAAIFVIAISLAYYLYGRIHAWRVAEHAPGKMGLEVQQSTQGFTLSKSEAGRTIFTVHASNAVQYKEGGRAELRDVSILVYGRRSDRFDQIHGDNFEYDPNSGDIVAHGEVAIDLEGNAQGPVRPDQAAPVELKNPIHLKTSGLTFNQKTGAAATREKIEFRTPQATGNALGATYDAKSNTLTLGSNVHVETQEGATILARHAIITQNPRRAVLDAARMERPTSDIDADQLTLYLRDDNSISRMVAAGELRGTTRGDNPVRVEAAQGDFMLGAKSDVQSGVLSGGVKFQQEGPSPFHGTAGRATLAFGPKNVLTQVKATENVRIIQNQRATANQAAQSVELASDALDLFLSEGRPERGVTGGAARITIRPQTPAATQGDTVITAGRFDMSFGTDGRLRALHGEPDARIVGLTPGQPDKVSTSQTLDVAFNAADGGISSVVQQGTVRYNDAQRSAAANEAHYTPSDENLVLTGSPRWTEAGGVTTARVLKLNRQTGDAFAEGEVKTLYRETRTQPGGALLGSSEPIHVTADSMTAHRQTGTALYSGSARLWQGTNIVEAPTIEFDRTNRVLKAKGARQPVLTVFVQNGGKAKGTPVTVTSSSLDYSDPLHRAVFQGGVLLKSTDGTVSADDANVLLKPKGQSVTQGTSDSSQIEEIVAQGHVVVQQPSRKAVGNTMTYTAAEGKYVMTGNLPSIFDAEHGVTTGDSLTFYSRDDTVLVGSGSSTRTVTQTHTGK